MSGTPWSSTAAGASLAERDLADPELGAEPHACLHYHLGMLLGVPDLQTEQAYHRGKMRLHNAWLHGGGVVWGFRLTLEDDALLVSPGLALDASGRELPLSRPMSLDLAAWIDARHAEARRGEGLPDYLAKSRAGEPVTAHLVVRHRARLDRQVPALDPAGDDETGTAPSRVREDIELLLIPGAASPPPLVPAGLRRLRLLLLGEVDGEAIWQAEVPGLRELRAALPSLPLAERAERLREVLARDVADLLPRRDEFGEPCHLPPWPLQATGAPAEGLVLGTLRGLRFDFPAADAPAARTRLHGQPVIDLGARPVHLPASVAALWLTLAPGAQAIGTAPTAGTPKASAPTAAPAAAAPAAAAPAAAPAAGPPTAAPPATQRAQVLRESVRIQGDRLHLRTTRPLDPRTLDGDTVHISTLGPAGWQAHPVSEIAAAADGSLDLRLGAWAGGDILRILLRGSGPRVILDRDGHPLDGAADAPASAQGHDGRDFIHMTPLTREG